eukprot:CAMPEP_0118907996 /NCGR_PEP_ID=MMETSP1166-20130328/11198_1 /TAXON_ID=1104430 /ORGANISM="Chrysoreinhardia sp, Strain CCMP3193" /LENGTH=341 /DNA_ID=CAMNT_0006847377 /DNA_START=93 /DNA_END=1115 /DNA_ORIENTATION=-
MTGAKSSESAQCDRCSCFDFGSYTHSIEAARETLISTARCAIPDVDQETVLEALQTHNMMLIELWRKTVSQQNETETLQNALEKLRDSVDDLRSSLRGHQRGLEQCIKTTEQTFSYIPVLMGEIQELRIIVRSLQDDARQQQQECANRWIEFIQRTASVHGTLGRALMVGDESLAACRDLARRMTALPAELGLVATNVCFPEYNGLSLHPQLITPSSQLHQRFSLGEIVVNPAEQEERRSTDQSQEAMAGHIECSEDTTCKTKEIQMDLQCIQTEGRANEERQTAVITFKGDAVPSSQAKYTHSSNRVEARYAELLLHLEGLFSASREDASRTALAVAAKT